MKDEGYQEPWPFTDKKDLISNLHIVPDSSNPLIRIFGGGIPIIVCSSMDTLFSYNYDKSSISSFTFY